MRKNLSFVVSTNQNRASIVNKFNIKQSELSILLVTLFVGNQPIRIHYFLKMNCLSFLKTLISICKMSVKKHLNFFELLYKKKDRSPFDFLIYEIDVDS